MITITLPLLMTCIPAHDMYESAAACASPSIYTSSIQAVWMTLMSRVACSCATAAVTTLQIHAQSNLACRPAQKHPWLRCSCCSLQQCQSVFCSWHVSTVQDGSIAQSAGACSYFGQQTYSLCGTVPPQPWHSRLSSVARSSLPTQPVCHSKSPASRHSKPSQPSMQSPVKSAFCSYESVRSARAAAEVAKAVYWRSDAELSQPKGFISHPRHALEWHGWTRLGRSLPCAIPQSISWDFRTTRATFRLKPSRSSRHCLAASMLAGDSSLGDDSMDMMEIMMVSTCMQHSRLSVLMSVTHARQQISPQRTEC